MPETPVDPWKAVRRFHEYGVPCDSGACSATHFMHDSEVYAARAADAARHQQEIATLRAEVERLKTTIALMTDPFDAGFTEAPSCEDHGVMVALNDRGSEWRCAVCGRRA